MSDVEKTANRLTLNMVRSLTWWCEDGEVREDVENATKRGLVNRGLVTWTEGPSPKLTPLGQQVREFLLAKAKTEDEVNMQALAARLAADRAKYDEGYAAGQKQVQRAYLTQLNQAVYGCDNWPDRPLDSVWEHLIGLVRKHFQPEETA